VQVIKITITNIRVLVTNILLDENYFRESFYKKRGKIDLGRVNLYRLKTLCYIYAEIYLIPYLQLLPDIYAPLCFM
jgi:hypothetical protein